MIGSPSVHAAPPDAVPGREHYTLRYLRGGRIFSYAHQMNAVIELEPRTALEVGVGNGMVAAALRAARIDVTTMDIQPELSPDLVGSVTAIPARDGAFDVSICCQVLEHLPFDQFGAALKELRRVSTKGLILSLPDITGYAFISTKLPKLGRRFLGWTWPTLRARPMPPQRFETSGHYWEIGFKGTPLSAVVGSIARSGWRLERTWRVPELPWHRFFELRTGTGG